MSENYHILECSEELDYLLQYASKAFLVLTCFLYHRIEIKRKLKKYEYGLFEITDFKNTGLKKVDLFLEGLNVLEERGHIKIIEIYPKGAKAILLISKKRRVVCHKDL